MKPETRKFLLNHPFLLGCDAEDNNVYMEEDENMFKVLGSMIEEYAATHICEGEDGICPTCGYSEYISQRIISTNVIEQGGIALNWLKIWEQIEIWYGDIQKRETGEHLLKRLQSEYSTPPKQEVSEELIEEKMIQLHTILKIAGIKSEATRAMIIDDFKYILTTTPK